MKKYMKKMLSCMVALSMILTMLPAMMTLAVEPEEPLPQDEPITQSAGDGEELTAVRAIAAGAAWDGKTALEPRQEPEGSRYLITCPAELYFIALNGGEWLSRDYLITDDLILNETVIEWDEEGNCLNPEGLCPWTPIGGEENVSFTGTLEGDGHAVSGLYINDPEMTYAGLFGCTKCASVRNLTITNSYVNGKYYVGSVAGFSRGSQFENCVNEGCVWGSQWTGGVAGWFVGLDAGFPQRNGCSLIQCVNRGLVGCPQNSSGSVGGIVGIGTEAVIRNCENHGPICGDFYNETQYADSGGIGGFIEYSEVEYCINTALVTGGGSVGGIVGNMYYEGRFIRNCINTGPVIGDFRGAYNGYRCNAAGGIVGDNFGEISNCINTAPVQSGNWAGGIAGRINVNYNTSFRGGRIIECANSGDITVVGQASANSSKTAGGIVAYWLNAPVTNCLNTGNVTCPKESGGIAGRTKTLGRRDMYIEDCCNLGNVSASDFANGGICGDVSGSEILNIRRCFFANNVKDPDGVVTAGQTACGSDPEKSGAEGRTLAELRDPATYGSAWGTVSNHVFSGNGIWGMDSGRYGGYPYLVNLAEAYPEYYPKTDEKPGGAPDGVWDGRTAREPGQDPGSSRYLITSPAELYFVAVTGGEWLGRDYLITDDLVLNETAILWDEDGNCLIQGGLHPWTPIGAEEAPFTGTLDGGGHTVSGTYFSSDSEGSCGGLFGYTRGATIKNLTLTNSYIRGNGDVGGIAAHSEEGILENCANEGCVRNTGGGIAGGIVGRNGSDITGCANRGPVGCGGKSGSVGGIAGDSLGRINGCANSAPVTGGGSVGGIAGNSLGGITGCVNSAPVTGSGSVGGIAGNSLGGIASCVNSAPVQADDRAGGIAGSLGGQDTAQSQDNRIMQCANSGSVTAAGERGIAGGIAAFMQDAMAQNCLNSGDVTARGELGGIAGRAREARVDGCCNLGCVIPADDSGIAGGICGAEEVGNSNGLGIAGSFFAANVRDPYGTVTAGQAACGSNPDIKGAAGKNLAELRNPAAYEGVWGAVVDRVFSANTVWGIDPDRYGGYPFLIRLAEMYPDDYPGTDRKPGGMGVDFWDGKTALEPLREYGGERYLITCPAELYFVALNGGEWLSRNYLVTRDLVLNETGVKWDEEGNCLNPEGLYPWTPIGTEKAPFTGTLEGEGHVVSGLYINDPEMSYAGLFGCTESASVRNLTITDSYVHGKLYVGSVAAFSRGGWFESCVNEGCVWGSQWVGGIAGWFVGLDPGLPQMNICTLWKCVNKGPVGCAQNSSGSVGGIVGIGTEANIESCENYGSVQGDLYNEALYTCAGGIGGFIEYSGVENCVNAAQVTGGGSVGGIAGIMYYEGQYIRNCVNTGAVTGDYQGENAGDRYSVAGGIAGDSFGEISGCINTAPIRSEKWAGGIVGREDINFNAKFQGGQITKCVNSGTVTAVGLAASNSMAGGIVANLKNAKVLDCLNSGSVLAGSRAGGLIGEVTARPRIVEVKECCNLGSVSVTEAEGFAGGICGRSVAAGSTSIAVFMQNSFFAVDARDSDGNPTAGYFPCGSDPGRGGAEGKTLAELREAAAYEDAWGTVSNHVFSGAAAWGMDPDRYGGYPYLLELSEKYPEYYPGIDNGTESSYALYPVLILEKGSNTVLDSFPADGVFSVRAAAALPENPEKVTLVVAAYDGDGRLLQQNAIDLPKQMGSHVFRSEFACASGPSRVKVFLLGEDWRPLCPAVVLTEAR